MHIKSELWDETILLVGIFSFKNVMGVGKGLTFFFDFFFFIFLSCCVSSLFFFLHSFFFFFLKDVY